MARVRLDDVVKTYGSVHAVDHLSLTINDGEFVALVGPSGCGKTTTLNLVAGLIELTSGDIFIGDRLVNDLDPKDWAEYGEPRTKYPHWLGSIVPDHEDGGYGIAEAILTEAARIKTTRPLELLAITGDAGTPASLGSRAA